MTTIHRLLLLLSLSLPIQADDTAFFTLETYSLPAAVWLKIPTTLRDDHALLRTTLIGQLPKGTITLRDRIGGSGRFGHRILFESQKEVFTPSSFGAGKDGIYPLEWEARKVGSSLELDANFAKSAKLSYRLVDPDPAHRPLLASGSRHELARAGAPMFPVLLVECTAPIAPVCLVALAPDPDRQQREKRLLVCFLVTSGLPDNEDAVKRPPGYTLELLGLRGSTRTAKIPPMQLLTDLLRRSDAHAFSIVTSQIPGPRGSLDAVQEFPHPARADKSPAGPVPTSVAVALVGTIMNAQLAPVADGKISAIIQIDHDWRDPVLPSVPGKDGEEMDKTKIPHVMQLRVRQEIAPGDWSLLADQPLSEVFGPQDRETKGESCYLFGRIAVRN